MVSSPCVCVCVGWGEGLIPNCIRDVPNFSSLPTAATPDDKSFVVIKARQVGNEIRAVEDVEAGGGPNSRPSGAASAADKVKVRR